MVLTTFEQCNAEQIECLWVQVKEVLQFDVELPSLTPLIEPLSWFIYEMHQNEENVLPCWTSFGFIYMSRWCRVFLILSVYILDMFTFFFTLTVLWQTATFLGCEIANMTCIIYATNGIKTFFFFSPMHYIFWKSGPDGVWVQEVNRRSKSCSAYEGLTILCSTVEDPERGGGFGTQ